MAFHFILNNKDQERYKFKLISQFFDQIIHTKFVTNDIPTNISKETKIPAQLQVEIALKFCQT